MVKKLGVIFIVLLLTVTIVYAANLYVDMNMNNKSITNVSTLNMTKTAGNGIYYNSTLYTNVFNGTCLVSRNGATYDYLC